MELTRFIEIAQNTNMVDAMTAKLIDRIPTQSVRLPLLRRDDFMESFYEDLNEPYYTELSGYRNWYWPFISQIPDVYTVSTSRYHELFQCRSGNHCDTILTKGFIDYVIENVPLRVGQKNKLAELLIAKDLPIPFEIRINGTPRTEDKRDAVFSALLRMVKDKPGAFTNIAKEELRFNGFDSEDLKRNEVVALVEEFFRSPA